MRTTRVVLAAAHLDHDPANNRLRNLRGLCQRCHLLHDRPHHLEQRRITYCSAAPRVICFRDRTADSGGNGRMLP